MFTVSPPGTSVEQFSPVQVETPRNLTGCALSGDRGLLMWANGGRVRFAVTANSAAWVQDGSVEAGDIATALTSAVDSVSCFASGGNVFFSVMHRSGSTGLQQIYKASDPDDPYAGWVLYSTVQSAAIGVDGSLYNDEMKQAGVPFISGSTWVYTGGYWTTFLSSYFAKCGLWVSTDGGVSWTNKIVEGFYLVGGSYIDYISPQISVDGNGDLYWATAGGISLNGTLWRSTNGGVSWSSVATWSNSDPKGRAPRYFGVTTAEGVPYVIREQEGVAYSVSNFVSDVRAEFSTHLGLGLFGRAAVGGDGSMYLFSSTTVQRPGGGWHVGFHHVRIR